MVNKRSIEVLFLYILFVNVRVSAEPDYYQYLQQFGYTSKVEGRQLFSVLAKSSYTDGILKFQRLYKLPETGQLDETTKNLMQKARCGNPDLGTSDSIGHPVNIDQPESESANIQGRSAKAKTTSNNAIKTQSWPKNHLKWFIEKYPEQQRYITSKEHINRIINQSFSDWQKYSGLTFEMAKTAQTADFKIKFQSKDHGDGYPFDGPGVTLAHAFYPTSGAIHFDDDEDFTDDYTEKYEHYTLRLIAAHEIGHALGLSHSFENGSLMYPIYQQFEREYQLPRDDQQEIQKRYGRPEMRTPDEQPQTTRLPFLTSTHSSNILPMDNWCSEDFQTGCEGPDGELYLFKDNQVWRYQARKKRSWDERPTSINERFPSFGETTITACVRSSIGYTYLFRDYRMWQLKTHWAFDGPFVLNGRNYPQNPQIALLHRNSIYLIRNHLAFRLNEFDRNQELEILTIRAILNPPPNELIQAGFTYAKRHYIFTKEFTYVYDSTHGSLLPGYPKFRTNGWFACESTSYMPKTKRSTTSTMSSSITESPHQHDHGRDEDDPNHFHHHHHYHHHHHHRPRRPPHHRFPPHPYRRRWE